MTDPELRYTFTCPSCAGSFSIGIDRIPPVQARFSCPKCGKTMDFPSRDEARVYVMLQSGAGAQGPTPARAPEPAPPARPSVAPPAAAAAASAPQAPEGEKQFAIDKPAFAGDTYDRRAIRILIRSGIVNEGDPVRLGDAPAARASDVPELKPLFELRKGARFTPPAVCPRHTDRLAHYSCGSTARPLCEECAEEKKFGGTSVRVCVHCGGSVQELPVDHA